MIRVAWMTWCWSIVAAAVCAEQWRRRGRPAAFPAVCAPAARAAHSARARTVRALSPATAAPPARYPPQIVQPEEVALMCLSAALVVPPGAEAGWGVGFDSQAAQAALADFLLDRLLVRHRVTARDTRPRRRCTPATRGAQPQGSSAQRADVRSLWWWPPLRLHIRHTAVQCLRADPRRRLPRHQDDESPEYLSLGDLVISLIRDLGRPGGVLAMSMLTTMGVSGEGVPGTAASFRRFHVDTCGPHAHSSMACGGLCHGRCHGGAAGSGWRPL